MSVEVVNESGVAVDEAGLSRLARYVLDDLGVHSLAELSVLLVDEPAMARLHEEWMDEEGPTDVLAFPMDELRAPHPGGTQAEAPADSSGPPSILGDVVICPQVAAAQARRARHGLQDELDLLCTHGILHLLGYDHAEPEELARMFGLQDRLLASWRAARGRPAGAAGTDVRRGAGGLPRDRPGGAGRSGQAPGAGGPPDVTAGDGRAVPPGAAGPVPDDQAGGPEADAGPPAG